MDVDDHGHDDNHDHYDEDAHEDDDDDDVDDDDDDDDDDSLSLRSSSLLCRQVDASFQGLLLGARTGTKLHQLV